MTGPARQSGVAVITALLIVALAVTISAGISTELQLDVRRTGNLISYEQSLYYVQPAEKLAMNVLAEDAKDSSFDHLAEGWAQVIPPIPLDGGQITGRITDLNACFNINNLSLAPAAAAGSSGTTGGSVLQQFTNQSSNPVVAENTTKTAVDRFRKLLSLPEININPAATDAVIDWIDTDATNTVPGGAEDGYYLYLDPPYRTANQTFKSISTLRLVKGFEEADKLAVLMPFVCAIDAATDINVNTAPAEVLISLDNKIESSDVAAVIQQRESQPFEKLGDFLAVGNMNQNLTDQRGVGVSSSHFLLTSYIMIGNARRTVYSIIHRDGTGKTRVISRTQNSL